MNTKPEIHVKDNITLVTIVDIPSDICVFSKVSSIIIRNLLIKSKIHFVKTL